MQIDLDVTSDAFIICISYKLDDFFRDICSNHDSSICMLFVYHVFCVS